MALLSEYSHLLGLLRDYHACHTCINTAGVEDVPRILSPNSYMDVDKEDDMLIIYLRLKATPQMY